MVDKEENVFDNIRSNVEQRDSQILGGVTQEMETKGQPRAVRSKKEKIKTIKLQVSSDGTFFYPVKKPFTWLDGYDAMDFAVPFSAYNSPQVETSRQGENYFIEAPANVLAKFNPIYATKRRTPGEAVATIRGGGTKPEAEVKLSKQDFAKAVQSRLDPSVQEETTFQSKFYTYDELMSPELNLSLVNTGPPLVGTEDIGTGGTLGAREVFSINLPDPTTGQLTNTEAIILPASSATTSGSFSGDYYYVAPLNQAVEDVIRNYVAENSITDLKQQLLSAGYMAVDDYNLSVGTVNELIADASTKAAVVNALVDLSANSAQRLREGDKKVFDFSDWLTVNQTSERSRGQVTIPGAGAMKQVLDSQYQKFYGRKSTQEEFLSYQEQVMQAAVDNVQKSQTMYSTDGQAVQVTTEGFSNTDLFQIAESLTEGTQEREQYYGANRLNRLTMQAFNQSFGSGQASLEELLR